MGKFEIEQQISTLQNSLTNESENTKEYVKEQGSLKELINGLMTVSSDFDECSAEAMRTINNRLDALQSGSRFPDRYRHDIQSLIYGESYNRIKNLLGTFQGAVQKRIGEIEDAINRAKRVVSNIQSEIDSLKDKLLEIGDEI